MPPLPVVPNCAKVRHVGLMQTHYWQIIQHFNFGLGPAGPADMVEMATVAHQSLASRWITTSEIAADCTLLYTTATDLSSMTGAFGQYTHTDAGTAGTETAASTALVVSWDVDRRFRGGHYRTYLPGIASVGLQNSRTWTATAIATAAAWADHYASDVAAGSYPAISTPVHVGVSYYDRMVNPVPPYRRAIPYVDIFRGHTEGSVIRSQRRRVRNTPTPT